MYSSLYRYSTTQTAQTSTDSPESATTTEWERERSPRSVPVSHSQTSQPKSPLSNFAFCDGERVRRWCDAGISFLSGTPFQLKAQREFYWHLRLSSRRTRMACECHKVSNVQITLIKGSMHKMANPEEILQRIRKLRPPAMCCFLN